MTDRDPDSSRNLLEGKQNNLHKVTNNGQMKSERYLEDHERLRAKLAQVQCYLYGLAAVVIAGMLILIVVVAVLYGKLHYDVTHHSHQPKVGEQIAKILEQEELCFMCKGLILGPSPEEENMLNKFIRKEDEDGEKCCVETPSQLLDLLELFIERRYREEMAKGNIKIPGGSTDVVADEARPSAHLMGTAQRLDLNQAPGKQFPISKWIHTSDLAFTNQVNYRHGRVVVPSEGLYYVYSQVSFLEVFNVHGDDRGNTYSTESPSLSHYLYRYNIIYPHGGEETLIQNSITKCWGQNKAFGEYTSYLGAVFHLRQGDEVFVKVSNLSMVSRDPKSNYFGLFKL